VKDNYRLYQNQTYIDFPCFITNKCSINTFVCGYPYFSSIDLMATLFFL